MSDRHAGGFGLYFTLSALFHIALIGLIVYLSLRYKPEIQSLGSKVVVSVVSRIPGPLASVKSVMEPPRPTVKKENTSRPAPPETKSLIRIPVSKTPSPFRYPENRIAKNAPARRHATEKPVQSINPSAYANLQNAVSLNNAYNKLQGSMVKGNVHRYEDYINKIEPIITGNFNISLNKYLNYKSVVAFQISGKGIIYGVRLVKSSGDSYFDSQSVQAVEASSPLPPPPSGFMEFVDSNNAGAGALIIFNPKEILKGR